MQKLIKKDYFIYFLFIIVIFFLIRKGAERNLVSFIFSMIIILECIYKKRKINFIDKKLIFLYGVYSVFLILSYLKNPLEIEKIFEIILSSFLFFWCLAQMEIKEKFYNKILFIITILSLISSYRGFREWMEHSFAITYRITLVKTATIYTVEIGIYIFISLFSIFILKNIYLKILSGMIFLFSFFVLIGTHSRVTLLLIPILLLIILIGYLIENKKLNYKTLGLIIIFLIIFFNSSNIKQHTQRLNNITNIEKMKNEARVKIYIKGLQDFKENEFKPLGYFYYSNHDLKAGPWKENNPHLHNNILEVLVTQGIGALISYLCFNILLFINLLKRLKEDVMKEQKYMIYLGLILFLFINLGGLVDTSMYFIKSNLLISIVYGLSFCKVIPEKLK